jgi:copper chaperone CopZ
MERSVLLEIEGMTCDGCAQTIERALKRDQGVREVRTDWQAGIAEVRFNPEARDVRTILGNRVFQRQYRARLGSPGSCC